MNKSAKIYVAGHSGMVGSAIVRKLQQQEYTNILTRSSAALDLRNQYSVNAFFSEERPQYVFLAAAKVGGILANNQYRADFIYENLMIEANVIHAAYLHKTVKLLFLGSSCIYPKMASQPLKEEYMLTGFLEETNQPYAIAKIAGIEMCDAYRRQYGCNFVSVMPTNLYGPNDNYDLATSHVLPALLRKFITATRENAPEVVIWGTGIPKREFMHVDDLADACLFLMNRYNDPGLINIGLGSDIAIRELAHLIQQITGYQGNTVFDYSKPDGTLRKLLDITKLEKLGWKHRIPLVEGITKVYEEIKDLQWN
jgi:GDP-L-fucose synthase